MSGNDTAILYNKHVQNRSLFGGCLRFSLSIARPFTYICTEAGEMDSQWFTLHNQSV